MSGFGLERVVCPEPDPDPDPKGVIAALPALSDRVHYVMRHSHKKQAELLDCANRGCVVLWEGIILSYKTYEGGHLPF